jgi:hypothetical protein
VSGDGWTLNDSPHPHASLIFGLLNANFELIGSSVHVKPNRIVRPAPKFILDPIHLTPNNAKQRFRIDEDGDPILFDALVEFARGVDVF